MRDTEQLKTFKVRAALTIEYVLEVPITKEEHGQLWKCGAGDLPEWQVEDLISELLQRANMTYNDGDITDAEILGWEGVFEKKTLTGIVR